MTPSQPTCSPPDPIGFQTGLLILTGFLICGFEASANPSHVPTKDHVISAVDETQIPLDSDPTQDVYEIPNGPLAAPPREENRKKAQNSKWVSNSPIQSRAKPELERTSPPQKSRFDAVPDHQVDSLVKRLELVTTLILRHGRAYDYKQMTTVQLLQVLQNLDDQAAQEFLKESTSPAPARVRVDSTRVQTSETDS